jgi:hypothetical protein
LARRLPDGAAAVKLLACLSRLYPYNNTINSAA